jgi:hypothetical protein
MARLREHRGSRRGELTGSPGGTAHRTSFAGHPVDETNVRGPDISIAREVLAREPDVALDEGLRTTMWRDLRR